VRLIGYRVPMQIEVFASDAEALEAAAALAETTLRESPAPHPAVAISGGRGGRAIMLALSGRGGLPWSRTRFCVADESCVAGETSSWQLLREHLLAPRGVAPHEDGPGAAGDARAADYEAWVRDAAGAETTFDLLLLDLGGRGELGALGPEMLPQTDSAATTVRIAPAAGTHVVERVGLGPAAFVRARRVIVLALGAQRSQALAAAVRAGDTMTLPASLVLPSVRATWFADRAAATELLRDAQPARA
jgi:6-phosphogluconolactonase/glucosamine-6-phosphate isomerase/deaminase